jgi:hypothetical protein
MGYLPMGDVASSEYNATKYPGVVKPSTFDALATFKNLQNQLNRVAAVSGNKPIAVDGDIGPGTVTLYAAVKPHLATYAAVEASGADATKIGAAGTATEIAQYADVIAEVASKYANSKGAPTTVPGPAPVKPPTLVSATGIETAAPAGADLLAAWKGVSTPMKLAGAAVLAGIGYFMFFDKKRRRRR